ncbi:ribonucleoside triphosphate reductase [Candidatus Bathyarchaeota archaeon]|nr:ribonucleoside triphosphate reductase [Candidatus Bathyarchaeota archaeon]
MLEEKTDHAYNVTKIRKRDGRIVEFNPTKITEAIWKAAQSVGGKDKSIAEKLTKEVIKRVNEKFAEKIPTVEDVQDIVEKVLVENGHYKTAKAYILYREQHRQLREVKNLLLDVGNIVDSYIAQEDWRVKENANATWSFSGLLWHVTGTVMAYYGLNLVYPKEIAKAHTEGDFHLHNLSMSLAGYCAGWSLRQLLHEGFNGVPGKVESSPPKHLRSALGQMVNFIGTLQNEWAGAQAFSSFDTYLAPFVYADRLNYVEVKQAIQEFVFGINISSRWGGQTPFSNITLDWTVPEDLKDEHVTIGGELKKNVYGDFQDEMNMINKAFMEVMLEGDAKGRVFTFPIPTYNITKDFDWDSENAELLFEMTAKYGLPYFQNFINSNLHPSDVRAMCLGAKEEILIRNSGKIQRLSIKEVVEKYKAEDFDEEGWAKCKKEKNLEVLSLNPQTLKVEWAPVKRFLRILDSKAVEITSEDGKKALFSLKHPVAVYTLEGIKIKFAQDIQKGDYILTLKKANENVLSKEYQKIDNLTLNEELAKILGYFVADGNYIFENRKGYTHFGEPRGIQITFRSDDKENLDEIKSLIKKVFNQECKEKKDPRYNTCYLYVYNAELARKLYKAGFKKYGRVPQILFNSPISVIQSFLKFYFKGDGYERRKEIHLNDLELSRDLVLLFSLIGQPVTYKIRKKSQRIYLQHVNSKLKKGFNWLSNPILAERIPGWMVTTTKVPGLGKSRTVGILTLEKYDAHTKESLRIKNSDIYLVRVKKVKTRNYKKLREFYDIELERNHLFLHSLGQISFNCCRLQLNLKELKNKTGALFGAGESTGSIGVVTINMPRIGYLSRDENEFFERLDRFMYLAKQALELKRKIVSRNMDAGLLPYTKRYLGALKNHFSTIGLVGMNEACLNFLRVSIAENEGKEFALKTLDFIRGTLIEFQEETGHLYNLEATPAEGTAYRLAKIDKKYYPKIVTAGDSVPYYTNSTHLPVEYTDDLWFALKHQEDLQVKYTGGTVFHAFLGESPTSEEVRILVKKIAENFRIPYYTITPTFSICPNHGYLKGEKPKCQICNAPSEVYSRVVGYLRPVKDWNAGKQEEFKERKEYKITL